MAVPDEFNSEWLTRKRRIDPILDRLGWAKAHEACQAPFRLEEYETANGPADYALGCGSKVVAVVEAKKLTLGPQNVLTQAERYSRGATLSAFDFDGFRVPFLYSGTAGFLVCAYEWLLEQTKGALERDVAGRIKTKTYYGQELVPRPRRLALMNLYLHGLEPTIWLGDTIYETPTAQRFDIVLTNPPFGTKGANQVPDRDDFTIETSNKQLNFVQHVLTVLKPGGRAAIVLPDNCLFADQAGEVFEILTQDCDLHTVLRLPRGSFSPYSPGVKANVVFFTKGYPTEKTWIYDGRSNVPGITKKDRPLTAEHFAEFETCYGSDPSVRSKRDPAASKEGRWRSFNISEVKQRDFKLDSFKWIKDESLEDADELPEPEELATDAIGELEGAVEELNAVLVLLENGNVAVSHGAEVEQDVSTALKRATMKGT